MGPTADHFARPTKIGLLRACEVPTVQCEQWLRTLGRTHELLSVLVVLVNLVAALLILLRKT